MPAASWYSAPADDLGNGIGVEKLLRHKANRWTARLDEEGMNQPFVNQWVAKAGNGQIARTVNLSYAGLIGAEGRRWCGFPLRQSLTTRIDVSLDWR
jgi:hypothetical protein